MIATPIAQSNASIVMTLQGHISEHISMMSEIQAQQEIMGNMTPEQQALMQQDPQTMQQVGNQIASRAAELASEIINEISSLIN